MCVPKCSECSGAVEGDDCCEVTDVHQVKQLNPNGSAVTTRLGCTHSMGSAQPYGKNVHISNPFATGVTLASQAPTSECCSKECVIVREHVRVFGCKGAVSKRQEDGESWKMGEV